MDDEPLDPPFDVEAFLARPLTARLATDGPTVRPVWFEWDGGAFWVFSGPWARWFTRVHTDPGIALIVDTCDLATGEILQVIAHGRVEILDWDVDRARRMLARYLGPDEERWPEGYRMYLSSSDGSSDSSSDGAEPVEGIRWVRLVPGKLLRNDFSFQPSGA